MSRCPPSFPFFFFNDTATTEIYTLSLHDALPIYLLPAFAAMSIGLAMTAVWGRMTFQRRWRDWLTLYLLGLWLNNDNYRRVDVGAREPQLREYRIAEDARLPPHAPIDLVLPLPPPPLP